MRRIQGIKNNSRDRQKYFSSHLHSRVRQDVTRRLHVNATVSTEKLYITECVRREPPGLYESHCGPGKEHKSFSLEPSYVYNANGGNQEKVSLLSPPPPDQLAVSPVYFPQGHLDTFKGTKKASRSIQISVGFQLNRRQNSLLLVSYMIFFPS